MFNHPKKVETVKPQATDEEILQFLNDISKTVNIWDSMHFPLSGNKPDYAYLKIQDLKNKFGYRCLERIKIRVEDADYHGTVLGEHAGKLHINLDVRFYAQAVDIGDITRDSSGMTQFDSALNFEHKYLGFYLLTHNQYIKDTMKLHRSGFNNNFWAKMNRNTAYIQNLQYVGKVICEKK